MPSSPNSSTGVVTPTASRSFRNRSIGTPTLTAAAAARPAVPAATATRPAALAAATAVASARPAAPAAASTRPSPRCRRLLP
ncbi:Os05g0126600, partial [Oryza sativa Japonica Group]